MEREGISFQHPARFVLVGSMNPEEGDLRPQLLDRFAHAVDVIGIPDAKDRVEILRRRMGFEQKPEDFFIKWAESEENLGERIIAARRLYDSVTYTDKDLYTIAALTASFAVDGHRADIVILKTARAQAAYDGRTHITDRDILAGGGVGPAPPHEEAALPEFLPQPGPTANQHAPGPCRGGTGHDR